MSFSLVGPGDTIFSAITQFSNTLLNIDLEQDVAAGKDHEVEFKYVTYAQDEYINFSSPQKNQRYVKIVTDRPTADVSTLLGLNGDGYNEKDPNLPQKLYTFILEYVDAYSIFRNSDAMSNRYTIIDFENDAERPKINYNQQTGAEISFEEQNIDDLSVVQTVATDFIGAITTNTANDIFNLNTSAASNAIDETNDIQNVANSTANSNINQIDPININIYKLNDVAFSVFKVLIGKKITIGYNIHKYEKSDVSESLIDTTFVSNLYDINDSTGPGQFVHKVKSKYQYRDYDVLMGKTYVYAIYPVFAYFSTTATQSEIKQASDNNNTLKMNFAILESRYFKRFTLNTDDSVKPNPPSLKIKRNFAQNIKISWSPNSQFNEKINGFPAAVNDTKGFLVFIRHSINEPFQLIKAFDFSDSISFTNPINNILKNVPPNLKVFSNKTITSISYNVNEDVDNIIAVCSYDARGNISNLSEQVLVNIKGTTNEATTKYICQSGALIQQPNLYINNIPNKLDTKLFLTDSFNASKYKKIKIFHTPETDFVTSTVEPNTINPNYKVQLIDIFTQQQKIVDIFIEHEQNNATNLGNEVLAGKISVPPAPPGIEALAISIGPSPAGAQASPPPPPQSSGGNTADIEPTGPVGFAPPGLGPAGGSIVGY
jgi:hypothetical protein